MIADEDEDGGEDGSEDGDEDESINCCVRSAVRFATFVGFLIRSLVLLKNQKFDCTIYYDIL